MSYPFNRLGSKPGKRNKPIGTFSAKRQGLRAPGSEKNRKIRLSPVRPQFGSFIFDRFTIEKDDALEEESMERLEKLMERSRTFFQPEAASLIGRIHRIRSRIREGKLEDETAKTAEEAEQKIRKMIAAFLSTPHRLIRSYDAVHGTDGD